MKCRLLLLVLLPFSSWAGSAAITKVRAGIVRPAHMNQFFGALTQDLMPRNSSGVVTDAGGSIGLGPYRWDVLYVQSLKFGSVGSFITIDSTGFTGADITPATTPQKALSVQSETVSSSCGVLTLITSSTFVDVTNLSVSITSTGRPIHVYLKNTNSTGSNYIGIDNQSGGVGTNAFGAIRLLRDGSEVFQTKIGFSRPSGFAEEVFYGGPTILNYLDPQAAGTYTYKVQAKIIGTVSPGLYCTELALAAYEEL